MAASTLELTNNQRSWSPLQDAIVQLLKNKAAVISGLFIIGLVLIAIFAYAVAPHPYDGANFKFTDEPLFATSDEGEFFLMGTDYLGRGNLSRTIFGTRISLSVAFVASIISLIVGIIYGLISGYGSATRDNMMMRFVDFLYGFPLIIFINFDSGHCQSM